MNELLFKNYKKSLNQKYNAVCFDIDGTLTEPGTKKIDFRAINMISNLLKRKVPIVFITGRGETGLCDLKNDIFDIISSDPGITSSDLKRIYVLINDGARLFYSTETTKEEFLTQNTYISTQKELNQLIKIDEYIRKVSEDKYTVSYSRDSKNNNILNIRLIFDLNELSEYNLAFNLIDKFIKNNGYNGIYVTNGIYRKKQVIQVGTAQKSEAIEKTEKILGIPKNSMMRIGDCGDIHGTDYSMLNCNQGYSVDKTSGSLDSCFPIFDEKGNILTGVEATLELIKKAKILPTVCLEKAEKKDFLKKYAQTEKNIILYRNKLLHFFNTKINEIFNEINGIDSIFDKFSGSIIIPMYEWELMSDNSLKEFWSKTIDNKMVYCMKDDNNYLLRGSKTYYFFLANRISIDGKDKTTKKDVINWYNYYLNFMADAINAVSLSQNLNDQLNKKLILGILDNCRNVLLILLNHNLVLNSNNNNILLNISAESNNDLYDLTKTIIAVDDIMSSICFDNSYVMNLDDLIENIQNTVKILVKNYKNELYSDEKEDYSKDYRAYREIDNFAENYIAVYIYNNKCNGSNRIINSCGLSYGGIELPIISKVINQQKVEQLFLLKFNKNVSGYFNKQNLELRKFNIKKVGGILGIEDLSKNNLDLFDDNILTGKTLQIAINSLYDYGIDVNNICIVRYPGTNRVDQMFYNNTSAIDYNLFFNYIYGLCFSSPYSWKDDDWKTVDNNIDYTDSLGVFDLNRKKIIECLIKNHDYKAESEVGEFKRRLIK